MYNKTIKTIKRNKIKLSSRKAVHDLKNDKSRALWHEPAYGRKTK
jgi:hypothetical protein